MPEQFFRYVKHDRVAAWEAAGWRVISPPLQLPAPHACECGFVDTVIVEWDRGENPIEPADP